MAGIDMVNLNCSLSKCFMPLTDSGGRIVTASIFLMILRAILMVLIISKSHVELYIRNNTSSQSKLGTCCM